MPEPSDNSNPASGDHNRGNTSNPSPSPPPPNSYNRQGGGLINYVISRKIDSALWLTRMLTLYFSITFILPVFGNSPYASYQRALLSNAATSALRLHQRMPSFQFTSQYFSQLFLEDSAHYLMFSIIFLFNYPLTLVLIPIAMFALLHATKFTKDLLSLNPGSLAFMNNLISQLESNQVSLLRFIAITEIILMPAIIVALFMGRSSILVPFIYYRFLTLRYMSRRNPYCRQIFYELRVGTEQMTAHPNCPSFVRSIAIKGIAVISRLQPTQQPQAPPPHPPQQ